jgi:hypothetical protein
MLTIHDNTGPRLCDGLTRRDWMRIGGLGMLGLNTTRAQASKPTDSNPWASPGKAKSVILLCFLGGPSQHDTWDPKPKAPREVQGPYVPIATNVPGIQVGELMPRTARHLDKCCVLRAVSTGDNSHSTSGYAMLTGRPHLPLNVENALPAKPNDWPCLGAVVKSLHRGNGTLPSAITLPEHIWNDGAKPWPGQDAGFLGRNADPWLIHCDPTTSGFQIPGLGLPEGVPALRLDERRGLLDQVNRHLDRVEGSAAVARFDDRSRQAFDLVRSTKGRQAFDLDQEPDKLRDRYGRYRFGQSCLLARRLAEARVPLIQVNWVRMPEVKDPSQGGWDTHAKHNEMAKSHLMPLMDQTYSALLEDLAQRGLLDETLVVWMGEFGRTPSFNQNGGRDHWGHVFSIALAGGGVQGGRVIGASDSKGAFPKEGKVTPADLHATLLYSLGIAPHAEFHDAQGRPYAATTGAIILQAF